MRCFRCLKQIETPEELFSHIKNVHEICGNSDFKCSLCLGDFEKFQTFKVHVRNCYAKTRDNPQQQHIDEAFDIHHELNMEFQDEITNFKHQVEEMALNLVVTMSSNMSIPRDLVFKTLADFQSFNTKTFIQGLENLIVPCATLDELKSKLKRLIKSLQAPFFNFNTESKLDTVLTKRGLIEPISKCLLEEDLHEDPLHDPDDDFQMEEDLQLEAKTGSMTLMPIGFALKKFLELPNVFSTIEEHTKCIREGKKLNNIINGKLWEKKLENFDATQTVIPYCLYVDGAQVNNALGTHCRDGLLDFNYITLPTIPTEHQSKLENIFVTSISPDNAHFGVECQFKYVVEELAKLATEGIDLTINGEKKKVFFVCACFIGDNKESNKYLGFIPTFTANFYCRYCRLHRREMQKATVENPNMLRDRNNYYQDVLTNDRTKTGVEKYSILNDIPYFHVTDSSALDNTHTIDEGICHYNLLPSLRYFINEQQYLTLEQFNNRLRFCKYNEDEKHNIPMPILTTTLNKEKKKKFRMTASEMFNFVHNLIFMIGDMVPEDDPVWQFVLTTVKFVDLAYLPCYAEEDIDELSETIALMNSSYVQLFNETLKPVHHLATHYPSNTRDLGPLRYLRTIRCEGKHKPMKNYTKNTTNRINICFSIGEKTQYSLAKRFLEFRGLDDIVTAKIRDTGSLVAKVYCGKLEPSVDKVTLLQGICAFTNEVTINGTIFKCGLWLPMTSNSDNCNISKVMEIGDILSDDEGNIFAVCKTYISAKIRDMNLYKVDMMSVLNQFSIINIRQYLKNHQYPVNVHAIGEGTFFRCKRF